MSLPVKRVPIGDVMPALVTAIAILAGAARAENGAGSDGIVPTSPVEHFKIYGFDKENGWRNWQLEGNKAVFSSDGSIDIAGMRLHIFEASDRQTANMLIESPRAVLDKERDSISGPDTIVMNSSGIFLGGENWTWRPDDRKLTIRTHTHAVIQGEIGPVLE